MPRLTAEEIRQTAEFEVELRPGRTVLVRPASFATQLFTGRVPQPLSAAMTRLEIGWTPEQFAATAGEDKDRLLELLRYYALHVVVEPVLVAVDDGNPAHVPVTLLMVSELLTIYGAKAPSASPVLHLPEADAERFRGESAGDVATPVRTGDDVPSKPVDVGVSPADNGTGAGPKTRSGHAGPQSRPRVGRGTEGAEVTTRS